MKLALLPAIRLMEQLRLLPKFLLVTLMFMLPLLLVTGLLFNELEKSIAFARQEQTGLQLVARTEALIIQVQQQRALRHMTLGGNAKMAPLVTQTQAAISKQLRALSEPDGSVEKLGLNAALVTINKSWTTLQAASADIKAKDSYIAYSALIVQLQKLKEEIADRTRLRLDPETNTHYLALTLLDAIPALSSDLLTIGGRGASYIDTGLLEANEEVMLASTVTMSKFELTQLTAKLDALFYETPAWKTQLQKQLTALPATNVFLERATNEVLKSLEQTSGEQFFLATGSTVQALQDLSNAASQLLQTALDERIANHSLHRNLMMAAIMLVLLIAGYLLAGFYFSFRQEITLLGGAVERAAAGDLRHQGAPRGKDEIALLGSAFTGMSVSLSQLIADVRSSGKIIAVAAREIAIGNGDLSNRTESQASSLEETASSMEELTATVHKNADNAQQANRLALSASDFAVKGGTVVNNVVVTMDSIKQSSRQIVDIIGVIDSIAFQTNILALNAAVEAARAGEQGRGFAVVATEVRGLAQRSASAAKEIKILINDSVSKIDAGGKQVHEAGRTMNDIVTSISHVVTIMADITAASQEQSSGIAEVNNAVAQIDEITQQNAALVEEAAAAAESLQEQADMLARAVSVFKLEHAEGDDDALPHYSPPAPPQISNRQRPAPLIRHQVQSALT